LKQSGTSPLTQNDGEDLKHLIGATAYVECSAKLFHNVKEVFEAVIEATLPKQKAPKGKKGLFAVFGSKSVSDDIDDDIKLALVDD
jgi:hypothetical protein